MTHLDVIEQQIRESLAKYLNCPIDPATIIKMEIEGNQVIQRYTLQNGLDHREIALEVSFDGSIGSLNMTLQLIPQSGDSQG